MDISECFSSVLSMIVINSHAKSSVLCVPKSDKLTLRHKKEVSASNSKLCVALIKSCNNLELDVKHDEQNKDSNSERQSAEKV